MLENKKFGVISLGCDKNRVDSEKLIGLLKERGCSLTDDLRGGDCRRQYVRLSRIGEKRIDRYNFRVLRDTRKTENWRK